jgi:hypothetical protein
MLVDTQGFGNAVRQTTRDIAIEVAADARGEHFVLPGAALDRGRVQSERPARDNEGVSCMSATHISDPRNR